MTDLSEQGSALLPPARRISDGYAEHKLFFQRCLACGAAQSLARYACARCAGEALEWQQASGYGTVYATTVVARAPSDEFRPLVPYSLVLVDLEEGARLMAHGAAGLAIDQQVVAEFFAHAGRTLARFVARPLRP